MIIHTYMYIALNYYFLSQRIPKSVFPWKTSCYELPGLSQTRPYKGSHCVRGFIGTINLFMKECCFPDSIKIIVHPLPTKMLEAN